MSRQVALVFIVLTGAIGQARPASAELAFFASGRSLSIKSHEINGDSIVLRLRDGGEIVCNKSLIASFEPDEVPYPEPPAELVAATTAPIVEEPSRFDGLINRISAEQGVDARLVKAVIRVESAYEPRARSRRGAMGLMQLMPATARQYAIRDPYDPTANIEGGIRHLRSLLQRFDLSLALAAYNAGEAAVQRFGGIPPYPETRNYVSRILELVR